MVKTLRNKKDWEVKYLYSQYPFPNFPIKKKSDIYKLQIYRLVYGLTKEYLGSYKAKKLKIVDLGCGTGELMMGIADKNMNVIGMDRNIASLKVARENSRKLRIKNVKFKKFDLQKDRLPKEGFDFIYSIGVLHHLQNPKETFLRLTNAVKKGGYITIGLYNPYGRMHIRIKRWMVGLIAGRDLKRRVEVARKLFYRSELTNHELAFVADCYAHPFEKYFSFQEMLTWFERGSIKYYNATPPVDLKQNIVLIKNILSDFLSGRKIDAISCWEKIPKKFQADIPGWSSIIQLIWMVIGRGEMIIVIGRKI